MTHRAALLALMMGFAPGSVVTASDEPAAAAFRSAFDARFPKSNDSAAAIELERLAVRLGIDLGPAKEDAEAPAAPSPAETVERRRITPNTANERDRLSVDAVAAVQAISAPLSQFLDRELKSPQQRIGAVPAALDRFLTDHEGVFTAIESVLLRDRPGY